MNFTKSLMALALTGIVFTGCKESVSENTETTTANETVAVQPETASFSIEGMSCSIGCAKTIEKKLAGMDGVQRASVDFDSKMAKVEFDATKLTSEQLIEAVEAAADGKTYKVADVKSSGDQAMLFSTDPEKKDKKKKKKKGEKESEAATDAKSDDKPGCCSKKKACTA
ncbi:MAG: heavy-metal-associated domain-containing protein [Flavobacterium sp.]|nr:heavy-metal-associated domain-containing protein [Flavobacterium sp.]